MLTIFSTPKPFEGHSGTIQRNALISWKLLHPQAEIILFGDEPGTAEICRELGLRHDPEVERTADGPPSVRSLFERAQQISCHALLCYSNCDIILSQDFVQALQRVSSWTNRFLMVGRRWDTDITTPVDFADPGWDLKLREFALANGMQRLYYNIDYFAFSKGLYTNVPRLTIGRNWSGTGGTIGRFGKLPRKKSRSSTPRIWWWPFTRTTTTQIIPRDNKADGMEKARSRISSWRVDGNISTRLKTRHIV